MIVFFDGVCGICNGFIDFLLKRDLSGALKFAPLQGDTAKSKLDDQYRDDLSSIILLDGDSIYKKSDAIIRIVAGMGGWWNLVKIFKIVPAFIRDPFYNLIAKNRYKWFGINQTCRMPTEQEQGRLLA